MSKETTVVSSNMELFQVKNSKLQSLNSSSLTDWLLNLLHLLLRTFCLLSFNSYGNTVVFISKKEDRASAAAIIKSFGNIINKLYVFQWGQKTFPRVSKQKWQRVLIHKFFALSGLQNCNRTLSSIQIFFRAGIKTKYLLFA